MWRRRSGGQPADVRRRRIRPLPPRTYATGQSEAARLAFQAALDALMAAERRARAEEPAMLALADEVIRRRVALYRLLERLGTRPSSGYDIQLERDAALLAVPLAPTGALAMSLDAPPAG